MIKASVSILLCLFIYCSGISQNSAIVVGQLKENETKPIELVNVSVPEAGIVTTTNKEGRFKLIVPANKNITIVFSHLEFETIKLHYILQPGEKKEISQMLKRNVRELPNVEIIDKSRESPSFIQIESKNIYQVPTLSGGVEALLKTMGASSNNELSSQYSVRGGNFDENLVYVNDIEIYRPFLVRSGQQEGLSFINSDLVSAIQFSAGGYEAQYGDKMSSVLDIKYKKPKEFAGSVSGSLLGGAAHLEYGSDSSRFSCLLGVRQKSNQYVLNNLETKGNYKPSFTDFQTFINYDISKKWSISILGNYSRNKYRVIPETRQTKFGTINEAMRLTVYFDGQEVDNYETYQGALYTTWKPNKKLDLKLIASAFRTNENESYDIQGQYWLDLLETDMGNKQFADKLYTLGVGTFLDHARNSLTALVSSLEHKGSYNVRKNFLQWGLKFNKEIISDKLNEWKMVDSADFTMPHPADRAGYTDASQRPNDLLLLQDVAIAKNSLNTNRISGFVQDNWRINKKTTLIAGVRGNWWSLNNQFFLSPRATITYKPEWERDFRFRFSTGYYNQPPFYREFRDFSGELNKNIKAQTSIHFVAGSELNFKAWDRPFKFTSEIYYKYLDNLIPYEVDNVRIRYFANNSARGYATGIDLRINGEFVKDAESWASISVMKTAEDIKGDYYYDYYNAENEKIIKGFTIDTKATDSILHKPGYIPRPTDQRVNFCIFFQDYLPNNPTYKMHMTLVYGTGLPFGPPVHERYKSTLRMPPYRRVDIGFSKLIKSEKSKLNNKNPLHYFKTIWLSLEVFNLLQINNTISYIWIQDVSNRYYAVPNYLTPRQLNIKLYVNF